MDANKIITELRELSHWWQSFAVTPEMEWACLAQDAADCIEALQIQLTKASEAYKSYYKDKCNGFEYRGRQDGDGEGDSDGTK